MKRLLTDRVDRLGALGQAAVGLLRAESAALKGELEGNARRLLGVVLLFVFALFALFWALAALVFSLVEVGAQWLPRWAAALVLVGLLALVALFLVLVARRRLARLESPAATVRRRADEYQEWWERRLAAPSGRGPSADRRGQTAADRPQPEPSPRADA